MPPAAQLPDTMLSNLLVQPGDLRLRRVPVPEPGPGEVLIRVRAALTCGTDLKTYRRGHPKFPMPTPLGHEFSGDVVRAGSGVRSFAVGDSLHAAPTAPCGGCPSCRRGLENLCDTITDRMVLGAFSEFLRVPEHVLAVNAFPLPKGLGYEEAAFLEPLACVVQGASQVDWAPADTAVILGAGPIGLLFLQLARLSGARRVIVCGKHRVRLEMAERLGAAQVVDISSEDPVPAILRATRGEGADVAVECVGQPHTWEQATALVRKGGQVLLFGGCKAGTTVTLDTRRVHYDQLTLKGCFHFTPRDVRRARELLAADEVEVRMLLSARVSLEELPQAFERLLRGDALKLAVVP